MNSKICCQIFCDAEVVGRIGAIGGQTDLDNGIGFPLQPFGCDTERRIGGKHHDTGMVVADAEFIFRTDHALRRHAAHFAFGNGKELTVFAENIGPGQGYIYLLPGCDVWRAAYDGANYAVADIHFGSRKVIGFRDTFTLYNTSCNYFVQING